METKLIIDTVNYVTQPIQQTLSSALNKPWEEVLNKIEKWSDKKYNISWDTNNKYKSFDYLDLGKMDMSEEIRNLAETSSTLKDFGLDPHNPTLNKQQKEFVICTLELILKLKQIEESYNLQKEYFKELQEFDKKDLSKDQIEAKEIAIKMMILTKLNQHHAIMVIPNIYKTITELREFFIEKESGYLAYFSNKKIRESREKTKDNLDKREVELFRRLEFFNLEEAIETNKKLNLQDAEICFKEKINSIETGN